MATAQNPLFCVLVPHFKDEYWLSVGYGLEQEAARQKVDLLLFEAGGYNARAQQIAQLDQCAARGVDAILIGAVSSDHNALIAAIAKAAQTVPVFGLVNAVHSDALAGRIGVDWFEMGLSLGHYLGDLHPKGSAPQRAVLLSGPVEAGWTGPLEKGLRAGLQNSAVTIAQNYAADTGLRQQLNLVEMALTTHPDTDYLIGSAPAVEAAIGLLLATNKQDPPQLLSTYISHTVLRGLMNGRVMAASFDDPLIQGHMAIQQAVATLRGVKTTSRDGPKIMLLTQDRATLGEVHLSPPDYFPAIR